MAKYNEILVGRYTRFLQKFLNMKGEAPAPQLAGELAAFWPLFHGVENRYLEAWERFGGAMSVAAAAGFESGFRLRNPSTSGIVVVLEKLVVMLPAGAAAQIFTYQNGPTAADLVTVIGAPTDRFDPRTRPNASLVQSQQNTTAAFPQLANGFGFISLAASQNYDFILFEDEELPILPGDAIQVYGNTVNVPIYGSFVWRERILEDSEKT